MAAVEQASKIDEEVQELIKDITRLGRNNGAGQYVVEYGPLFDDEKVEQYYEALMGTLKAAKKRGIVDFKGQILLKGAHDKTEITLLDSSGAPPPPAPAAPAAAAEEAPAKKPVAAPKPSAVAAAAPKKSGFKTAAEAMEPPTGHTPEQDAKFEQINEKSADEQCQFFLKSFIFGLKEDWKEVPKLLEEFLKHAKDTNDGKSPPELINHISASDFLQKKGKTRTAAERKAELNDVDINNDGFISFLEYLLLHFKVMILQEFYKHYEIDCVEDLTNDGIGIANVGYKLVDELLTMPAGMNPQIEAAIDEFMEKKKERENKIKELQEKADKGGVKGMAAKQELAIIMSGDDTEMNRVELTLQAAKRKAAKNRGSVILADMAAKEAAEKAKAKEEARARMAAKKAMFEGK
eukprot:CAMPEP_0114383206 /NCGR_PEP_ID=MMETSP0102-20121206/4592_1 /TAXON_ID=38822 ORGANISM="Pteridomonas danica, Strain PT" /NCGR_SAMPLE_ID=MMETSP0102 /ASSEMBLY_ACC=CAM_ASM_000212 /LENGTH=406 /DNA_ID=CAMNT_0001539205 /DNA_START=21 /DNA_END=1241 /DNA_ORIENTATION=-